HDWKYVGATHEYIDSETARTRGSLPELTLTHFADGGMRGHKFERDIELLTRTIEKQPDDPRTHFYLAQSYCDSGDLEAALDWYQRRIALDGWDEERWYAMYKAAQVRHALGHEWSAVEA